MKNHIAKISQKLKSKFYFDYDMSKNVWFRAGGKTSIFCLVYDIERTWNNFKWNWRHILMMLLEQVQILLVRDIGFDGIIFKLGKNLIKLL